MFRSDEIMPSPMIDVSSPNPPLFDTYKALFDGHRPDGLEKAEAAGEEWELPVIDLDGLRRSEAHVVAQCKRGIVEASSEWGFFQVVSHGIPREALERMREVMVGVFRRPFVTKARERLPDFGPDSYQWGTPTATSLKQLSWSEAYQIALSQALMQDKKCDARYECFQLIRIFKLCEFFLFIYFGFKIKIWSEFYNF